MNFYGTSFRDYVDVDDRLLSILNSMVRKEFGMRLKSVFQYLWISRFKWKNKSTAVLLLVSLLIFIATYNTYTYVVKSDIWPTWPENQTRDVRALIHPNENDFIIVPNDVCGDTKKEFLLLIIVTSAVQNVQKRKAIRSTWGRDVLDFNQEIKLIFLLGEQINNASQKEVIREHHQFGDVLQGPFVDTYTNLTLKSLYMLKYVSKRCKNQVQYIMKVDDDMYINVPEVKKLVMENTDVNMLTGFMHCGAPPMTHGKWYAPPYMLDGVHGSVYPNFLSGTAYVMSNTTAEILYRTALITPAFHLEDVYLTGILPSTYNILQNKMYLDNLLPPNFFPSKEMLIHDKEIHPKNDGRFNLDKIEMDPCRYANLISSHELNPDELFHIHSLVNALREKSEYKTRVCSKYRKIKKGEKTCTIKNTMFWGNGECCGYIDYYLSK